MNTEDAFDIYNVLKYAPIGLKLYSTKFGNVYLRHLTGEDFENEYRCISVTDENHNIRTFDAYGSPLSPYGSSLSPTDECSLFPSENDQDWTFWQAILIEKGDIVQIDGETYQYIGRKEYEIDGEIEELDTFIDSCGHEMTGDLLECGFANKQQIQAYELAMAENK